MSDRVFKGHISKEHRPIVTVDAVILTFDGVLQTLLWRRTKQPHLGELALCGGYVHVDEDASVDAAVTRVLRQKAHLEDIPVEQLHVFSGERDPRDWSVSVAFLALCSRDRIGELHEGVELHDVTELPRLAFDHNEIVGFALKRLRDAATLSTLPAALLPDEFTLPELQAAYEASLGCKLDSSSFRRKIAERRLLTAIDRTTPSTGRPAQLWRLANGIERLTRPL